MKHIQTIALVLQFSSCMAAYSLPVDASIKGSLFLLSFGFLGINLGWYFYGKKGGK